MKKKLGTKLILKKETLNDLNKNEMNSVLGGGTQGCNTYTAGCESNQTICCSGNCGPTATYITYTGGTICACQ